MVMILCISPVNPKKSSQISPFPLACPVGKQEIRIAAGADTRHKNPFFLYPCLLKNTDIRLPQIQLILSAAFFQKQTAVIFLCKLFLKLQCHIFTDFITILADGRPYRRI